MQTHTRTHTHCSVTSFQSCKSPAMRFHTDAVNCLVNKRYSTDAKAPAFPYGRVSTGCCLGKHQASILRLLL